MELNLSILGFYYQKLLIAIGFEEVLFSTLQSWIVVFGNFRDFMAVVQNFIEVIVVFSCLLDFQKGVKQD